MDKIHGMQYDIGFINVEITEGLNGVTTMQEYKKDKMISITLDRKYQ